MLVDLALQELFKEPLHLNEVGIFMMIVIRNWSMNRNLVQKNVTEIESILYLLNLMMMIMIIMRTQAFAEGGA
ncbi:MAG: hypothetical protein EZS28_004106, partial [Streblomastix strix]